MHPQNPLFFTFFLIDLTDYTFSLKIILNIVLIFKSTYIPSVLKMDREGRKEHLKCLLKYALMCGEIGAWGQGKRI